MEERFVFGTRSKKWHLVGSDDRDFKCGITKAEMKRIGKTAAKKKYLSPNRVCKIKKKTVSTDSLSKALHEYDKKPTFTNLKNYHKVAHKYHSERGHTALADEYGYLSSSTGVAALKADRRATKRMKR